MKRIVMLLVIIGMAFGTFAAFDAPASAQEDMTFYVIAHTGPGDPFWAVVQRGVQDAGRQLGVRAIFQGPPGRNVPEQVNMFNAAVRAGADGIATTISDPRAWGEPIAAARERGIPVVAINAKEPDDFRGDIPYMAYIGMDEYVAGRTIAEFMLPRLSEGAHVVVANQEPGHVGLEARAEGITDVLTEALNATVDKLDISQNPTNALGILRGYLSANPETSAIFTLGPLGTIPTVRLIKEEELQGKIEVAAFDLDTNTVNAIREGIVAATVDQQQYLQGYMAVVQLYLNAKYGFAPADYDTAKGLVTAENVDLVAQLVEEGYR